MCNIVMFSFIIAFCNLGNLSDIRNKEVYIKSKTFLSKNKSLLLQNELFKTKVTKILGNFIAKLKVKYNNSVCCVFDLIALVVILRCRKPLS